MPRYELARAAHPDRHVLNPFTLEPADPIPGKPASVVFTELDLDGRTLVAWRGEIDASTGEDLYAPQRRLTRFEDLDEARAALEKVVADLSGRGYRARGPSRDRGEPEPPLDPRTRGVEAFVAGLARVPWFVNLGGDTSDDGDVTRIRSFDEWLGPEDEGATILNERLQGWEDAFGGAKPIAAWPAIADRVGSLVRARASWNVAFDPAEDPWYGPNACAMAAAFVSTLVARHLAHEQRLPDELLEMWSWYARGHWPAAYDAEREPWRLVVL